MKNDLLSVVIKIIIFLAIAASLITSSMKGMALVLAMITFSMGYAGIVKKEISYIKGGPIYGKEAVFCGRLFIFLSIIMFGAFMII